MEQQLGVSYPEERINWDLNGEKLKLRGLGIGDAKDATEYGEINFGDLIKGKFKINGALVYNGCLTAKSEYNISQFTSSRFPDIRVAGRKGIRQTYPGTDQLNIIAQMWSSTLYDNGLNWYQNGTIIGSSSTLGLLGPYEAK